MALKVASRGIIPSFIVMDVMRAANERERANGDVIHMEVGQPSTPAPAGVLRAAHQALDADKLGYTDAFGLPELRTAIAGHIKNWYGVEVPPAAIAVTTGSSGGILLASLAAFDPGDRVVLVDPAYPCYRHVLTALGVEVVSLSGTAETRFQPTPALLDQIEGPLHGLVVASPANPTGTMLDQAAFRRLTDYCAARDMRLISDEIYHGVTYDMPGVTATALDPNAIVINSFSKYFSMTGWRLGWMVIPEDLRRPIECLAQNLFISAPSLSQHAALAAFDCHEELQGNVDRYRANRDLLLAALPEAGFDRLAPPDGAFYLYADVGHLTQDSLAFCQQMLAETGVAATPGVDFDPTRGQRYVRFSYAGATDDMAAGAEKLRRWLK